MSFRLIFIHFMYRIVFGVGIAALVWVGGNLVYAKTYQLYAISKIKTDPVIPTGISDLQLPMQLQSTPRRTSRRISNGVLGNEAHLDAFSSELQNLHVGDVIAGPSGSRVRKSPSHSELTIMTTPRFPYVGAVPQQFIVHARPQNELEN
jgi:hypothetical protein